MAGEGSQIQTSLAQAEEGNWNKKEMN